ERGAVGPWLVGVGLGGGYLPPDAVGVDALAGVDEVVAPPSDPPDLPHAGVHPLLDLLEPLVQRAAPGPVDSVVEAPLGLQRVLHVVAPRLAERERVDPLLGGPARDGEADPHAVEE